MPAVTGFVDVFAEGIFTVIVGKGSIEAVGFENKEGGEDGGTK